MPRDVSGEQNSLGSGRRALGVEDLRMHDSPNHILRNSYHGGTVREALNDLGSEPWIRTLLSIYFSSKFESLVTMIQQVLEISISPSLSSFSLELVL